MWDYGNLSKKAKDLQSLRFWRVVFLLLLFISYEQGLGIEKFKKKTRDSVKAGKKKNKGTITNTRRNKRRRRTTPPHLFEKALLS